MNDIIWSLVLFLGGSISLFSIIIYMFKKQRHHKDFLLSIILLMIFLIVFLYGSILAFQQVMDNKNRSVTSGICTISIVEDIGGRFDSYNLINVEINDIYLVANPDQFPNLEEGKYSCKVEYSKNVETIYSLKILNK